MKRVLVIGATLALVVSTAILSRVNADFAKAKEELRLQLENYNQVHREYQTTKAKYQQFKTLPAETEAFVNLRKVLAARTQVLQAYFALIQEKLTETGSVPSDIQNNLNSEIEGEKTYLTDFRRRALGAANLAEAENLSREFEGKQEGWQNLTTKYRGVIFTSAVIDIAQKSSRLIEKTSQTLAATPAITNITDLNLREEKLAIAKNKISQTGNLVEKARSSFLNIKFDSKRFEAKRAGDDAEKDANQAREILGQALTAVKEAARGF